MISNLLSSTRSMPLYLNRNFPQLQRKNEDNGNFFTSYSLDLLGEVIVFLRLEL